MELEDLYKQVRDLRTADSSAPLAEIFNALTSNHPKDWLLAVEIAELLKERDQQQLLDDVLNYLEQLKVQRPEIAHLIAGGLELIFENANV